MEAKEIQTRLEIIKLATTIDDHDIILLQCKTLKELNSSKLDEIITLLYGKNYRQAIYLIKNYLNDMGSISDYHVYDTDEDGEKVLDIEDMLRMSPLAKDTIKDYKRTIYTDDDLATFAKNIEKPVKEEYEQDFTFTYEEESEGNSFMEEIEEEAKENIKAKAQQSKEEEIDEEKAEELNQAINSANSDTPLDEISAEVLEKKEKKKSFTKSLSKYKKLREKFAKKENKKDEDELKRSNIAKTILDKVKDSAIKTKDKSKELEINEIDTNQELKEQEEIKEENVILNIETDVVTEDESSKVEESKDDNKDKKENNKSDNTQNKKEIKEKKDSEVIFSPIPHIEQKFRQAFILYPPIKESDMWVEEVVKFLKFISKNSFTQRDVDILLDEYKFYLEKRDIARAAQVLLLAASTESEYAQFILARELFSGKIIVRDIKKSFDMMKGLANKFYPDAVCDLAQFYEYGITVPKDRNIALKLYEKAFQLGVSRATKHINRLKESNSFFSTIFKLK